MLNQLFWISYALLWVLVLVIGFALFALYQYHGRLFIGGREARASQGPAVGSVAPKVDVRSVDGRTRVLGRVSERPQVVIFASPTCRVCAEGKSELRGFANTWLERADIVHICLGADATCHTYSADLPRNIFDAVDASFEVARRWRVSSTPFAVLLDEGGVVRSSVSNAGKDAIEYLLLQLSPPLLAETA